MTDTQPSHARHDGDPASLASVSNPLIDDAEALMRGAHRLLYQLGYSAIPEFKLKNNRRADLCAIGPKGEITIIEVKSGIADFRADSKWPDYKDFCDKFYFCVSTRFPADIIPDTAGLIIADGFGAAIVRESAIEKIAAARRKAVTLRFARTAADRAMRVEERED